MACLGLQKEEDQNQEDEDEGIPPVDLFVAGFIAYHVKQRGTTTWLHFHLQ